MLDQVCINDAEGVAGIVGTIVAAVSTIVNFIPAPDKLQNPIARAVSRILHFIAVDIVTATVSKPTTNTEK